MSLLTEYTQMIDWEIHYSLEHSVYLDLLIAVGGVLFFYDWERIPEGMDLERLVLRKMQKRYYFFLKAAGLLFTVILLAGEDFASLPDGIGNTVMKSFALPLTEAVSGSKSGILYCFQTAGVLPGVFLLFMIVLFADRMRRNYQSDKPVTGMLILISGIFLVQLLFWNPGMHNIVSYFYLMMLASFYREERQHAQSVKISAADLALQIQEIGM